MLRENQFLVNEKCTACEAGKVDEADRRRLPPSGVIQGAHTLELLVHTWTFRNEQPRRASDYQGNPVDEYLRFYALGIDGVLSDYADLPVVVSDQSQGFHGGQYPACWLPDDDGGVTTRAKGLAFMSTNLHSGVTNL